MADPKDDFHFTVSYRSKSFQLTFPAGSTVQQLGMKLVELTGVAPHTLKLMLPKRPVLQPMSAQHKSILLHQSGITEGLMVRMMGSSTAEVASVSHDSGKDRVRGFDQEEELARQRSSYDSSSNPLPKGNYIFCEFRTLTLPGIELTPPPSMALKIMHTLASDRGITAIMNKYRWRVGVMTEMAPVGYVGVSPKCILGFNKNRGQEISLRLRTDDLKGFRKYESIKKTLLHELAHMVHDEHDEKFLALDSKLNREAITLDWTKSRGQTWSGVKFEEEDAVDGGGVHKTGGRRLGGSVEQARYMDPRAAAAAAALRRFADNVTTGTAVGGSSRLTSSKEPLVSEVQPVRHEPDPDDMDGELVVVIGEGSLAKREPVPDLMEIIPEHPARTEPEPDDDTDIPRNSAKPDPDDEVEMVPRGDEPDPDDDDEMAAKGGEPHALHQDGKVARSAEPDPDGDDELMSEGAEPDPDDRVEKLMGAAEPDPDYHVEKLSRPNEPDGDRKEKLVRSAEPDPDDRSERLAKEDEPDPDDDDEMMTKGAEPDPDDHEEKLVRAAEPDPDDQIENSPRRAKPVPNESDRTSCKRAAGEACSPSVNRDYKQSCSF
ncbi:DNA-dependent metalloprotease WSS1 [Marchantia polymorpha subsp. ruderalis]|uniref:WLM domain-containing protein n=2 Tax=Marchantia polymorpha TaxID=3197 RepID=A0A176W667_MARPO|nr:hypothetical protein AXG93_2175s1640 [Marchantia polymorpha subsp. ruderalis]PTQ35476.1 hypothetical protein MARPO_0071s0087 [Marchantia polymorpha]BBN11846.1 hypothetical protein Mp_5g15230 [Marchantia polymorpha subsp. ruderalis]|eukprot:PTQ35476.1 hypothetical protein MARPO_0071s0087 [Marchantia polymorpha]